MFAIVQTVPDSLEIDFVVSQHTSLRNAGESLLATQYSHDLFIVQQDRQERYPLIVGECERLLTSTACNVARGSL